MFYRDSIINSLLLLFLSLSGNFLGSTMSCEFQYYMTNNPTLKHIVLIFIIFFTLTFISTSDMHPLTSFFVSMLVWVFYVLFTKQNFIFTILSLAIVMVIYINYTIIKYNQKYNKDTTTVELHNTVQDVAYPTLIGTIIIGNIYYLTKKYNQYGKDFNFFTYYVGTPLCKRLV